MNYMYVGFILLHSSFIIIEYYCAYRNLEFFQKLFRSSTKQNEIRIRKTEEKIALHRSIIRNERRIDVLEGRITTLEGQVHGISDP